MFVFPLGQINVLKHNSETPLFEILKWHSQHFVIVNCFTHFIVKSPIHICLYHQFNTSLKIIDNLSQHLSFCLRYVLLLNANRKHYFWMLLPWQFPLPAAAWVDPMRWRRVPGPTVESKPVIRGNINYKVWQQRVKTKSGTQYFNLTGEAQSIGNSFLVSFVPAEEKVSSSHSTVCQSCFYIDGCQWASKR